jgi:PRMT5 oligomerisation domain
MIGDQQSLETPYVVRPHHVSQMHDEQPCWTFIHGHVLDQTNENDQNNNTSSSLSSLERIAVITFFDTNHPRQQDRTNDYGAAFGCGYNPINEMIVAKCQPDSTTSITVSDDTIHHRTNHDPPLPCWILNGFLGTFTRTILYQSKRTTTTKTISLSTAPNHEYPKDMFSWFPLYFPFDEPILIPKHGIITLSMNRKCNIQDKKAWNEWSKYQSK